VRSCRRPVSRLSAQTLATGFLVTDLRQRCPAAVIWHPGLVACTAASRSAASLRSVSTARVNVGRTGSRARVRWSTRDLRAERSFFLDSSSLPDRAWSRPHPPACGLVDGPLGQVEVEGPHHGQVVDSLGGARVSTSTIGPAVVRLWIFFIAIPNKSVEPRRINPRFTDQGGRAKDHAWTDRLRGRTGAVHSGSRHAVAAMGW